MTTFWFLLLLSPTLHYLLHRDIIKNLLASKSLSVETSSISAVTGVSQGQLSHLAEPQELPLLFRTRNCLTPGLISLPSLVSCPLLPYLGIFIKIDCSASKHCLNFENSILFLLEEPSGMSPSPCRLLSFRLLPCQQSSHPSQYTLNGPFFKKSFQFFTWNSISRYESL